MTLHQRPESTKSLGFEYQTIDHWLVDHVKSVNIEEPGSEHWKNTFVTMVDYLANPAIPTKNSLLLDELTGFYMNLLKENPMWLESIIGKIDEHLRDCYNLGNDIE